MSPIPIDFSGIILLILWPFLLIFAGAIFLIMEWIHPSKHSEFKLAINFGIPGITCAMLAGLVYFLFVKQF